MLLKSNSFNDQGAIPGEFAFAVIAPVTHITLGKNLNPHLEWSDIPAGTESFVLICHDYDVPSRGDDVNKEDREIPASLPRANFHHWLLLDIPAATFDISAGSHSSGVVPHGKPGPAAPDGMRHGINDYTNWFAGDTDMRGDYYGYDGPCPPWNDSLLHHYVFTIYALNVPRLDIKGALTGANIRPAMSGRVIAEARLTGTYSLNPNLKMV